MSDSPLGIPGSPDGPPVDVGRVEVVFLHSGTRRRVLQRPPDMSSAECVRAAIRDLEAWLASGRLDDHDGDDQENE